MPIGTARPSATALVSQMLCVMVLASIVLPAQAQPAEVQCPASIPVQAGTLTTAPATAAASGMELFVPESLLHLTGVSVYDGPPKEGALLKPVKDNGSNVLWQLNLAAGVQAWVSCDYAKGIAKLVKPMPGATQQCSATVTKVPLPIGLKATLRCR